MFRWEDRGLGLMWNGDFGFGEYKFYSVDEGKAVQNGAFLPFWALFPLEMGKIPSRQPRSTSQFGIFGPQTARFPVIFADLALNDPGIAQSKSV